MKKYKTLKKAFGVNQFGDINFPLKISGVKISRILFGEELGCTYCFPHGFEVSNSTAGKNQRSWKKNRKTQWKTANI